MTKERLQFQHSMWKRRLLQKALPYFWGKLVLSRGLESATWCLLIWIAQQVHLNVCLYLTCIIYIAWLLFYVIVLQVIYVIYIYIYYMLLYVMIMIDIIWLYYDMLYTYICYSCYSCTLYCKYLVRFVLLCASALRYSVLLLRFNSGVWKGPQRSWKPW